MTHPPDPEEQDMSDLIGSPLAWFISRAPVAVALFDREMRYAAWSQPWAERYGLSGDELPGTSLHDHFPDLPTEFAAASQQALTDATEGVEERAIEICRGGESWDRWRITPLATPQGDVIGLALFSDDISRQKQVELKLSESESRLLLVTESLGVGLAEVDLETGENTVSPTFAKMLGRDADTLPDDMNHWVELMKPRDVNAFRKARRDALMPGGDGMFSADLQPVVGDAVREMRLIGRVFFADAGARKKPRRLVCILIDQTRHNHLQASLAKSQRLEAVGQIAGIIAHDFNNLLSVILANLELAAMRVSDSKTNEMLQAAMEAAEMGGNFNKKLLALSRPKEPMPQLVQVDDHILRVWAVLERLLNEHVSLRFSPQADDVCIRMDPAELDGAILNLVVNARDAQTSPGSIVIATQEVEIDTAAAGRIEGGKPGHFLELSVSDTGKGMSKSDIARAQEPFFTSKTSEMGTGLGLTSVAMSVARAGGFISLWSEPGQGTRVSLYLPVADGHPADSKHDVSMPLGDGELILVVEDDAMVREAALKRLEALGYAVIEASNGQAALDMLDEGEPVDLVFSDIVMPGEISGYDLMETMQRDYPGIPILLTSGHASRSLRPETDIRADLLRKPYSLAVLAQGIAAALRRTEPTG